MGIMSKGSGCLSERPLPPSLTERDEDLQILDDDDVVFTLGKSYMTDYYAATPTIPTTPAADASMSSFNSSSASSDIPQDTIDSSYSDVTRLLMLYSNLKDVPSNLELKYAKLKDTSKHLADSISDLKSLSQNFLVEGSTLEKSNKDKESNSSSSSSSKSKAKSRKKN